MSGVSASASPTTFSTPPSKPQTTHYYASSSLTPRTLSSSDLNLKSIRFSGAKGPQRITVSCNSSSRPGAPGPGDSDSRGVLDAFFLGKALAEAVNERIESTVGEFLSTIGRLQAEQQKQVQDFQDDVLERAKIAKEKAAREAVEAQGLTSKPSIVSTKPVANGVSSVTSPSTTNTSAPATPSSLSGPTTPADEPNVDPANEEPVLREGTDD